MNPSSTHEEPPPAYTKSGQQQITTADFQELQVNHFYFDPKATRYEAKFDV